MNDLTDRELARVRVRFLDISKSFFLDQPDAEIMSRWRGILSALAGAQVNPLLDQAVAELNRLLTEKKLQQLREEYYTLFIDPYSEHRIQTTASYSMDGKHFGPTLVRYRDFLLQAGIVRKKDISESEDSLIVMLDAMITLIEDEIRTGPPCRDHQEQLLVSFLAPAANRFAEAMRNSPRAEFYAAGAAFLTGYLNIEHGLLVTAGANQKSPG